MNEKKYKKRLGFQQKIIAHQSEQIDDLKLKIEKLENELKEKDEIINSVTPLRNELTKNINEIKVYKPHTVTVNFKYDNVYKTLGYSARYKLRTS